jgi:hypothetical protein
MIPLDEITFHIERLDMVAMTLIGSWPTAAEMQIRSSCLERREERTVGSWIRVIMPQEAEVGLQPIKTERFEQKMELGGRSFGQLPQEAVVTIESDLRGSGLLRRYLETRTARLFASPTIAGLPLDHYRTLFLNAIQASDIHCCSTTLAQVRNELRTFVAQGEDPTLFLSQIGERASARRQSYRLDAHLPASFRITSDVVIAVREELQAGTIPQDDAIDIANTVVKAFLDEDESLEGLGGRIASIVAQHGFEKTIVRVLNVYRDETSRARREALASPTHAPMLKTIFNAIPAALAADLVAKMMYQWKPGTKYEAIARTTDEELVRYSTALGIRCWTMLWPSDLRHQKLLRAARATGPQAVDALIQHWRGSLTFPDAILARMKNTDGSAGS